MTNTTRKVVSGGMVIMSKNDSNMLPPILNVADVKEYLGIGLRQAYELVNGGFFPILKINRRLKIPRDPFLKWVNREIEDDENSE